MARRSHGASWFAPRRLWWLVRAGRLDQGCSLVDQPLDLQSVRFFSPKRTWDLNRLKPRGGSFSPKGTWEGPVDPYGFAWLAGPMGSGASLTGSRALREARSHLQAVRERQPAPKSGWLRMHPHSPTWWFGLVWIWTLPLFLVEGQRDTPS